MIKNKTQELKNSKTQDNEEIRMLMEQREEYRKNKDWQKSDELRKEIEVKGYKVSDFADGVRVEKN